MTNLRSDLSLPQALGMSNPRNNFELTKLEFDTFAIKLRNGDESLFKIVYTFHFNSSLRFIQNKFNISKESAYDICMDTLLEFRVKVKNGKIKYGNLRYLFTKMAVNRYIDDMKIIARKNRAIQEYVQKTYDLSSCDAGINNTLNSAFVKLEESKRQILKEIFYSGKDTQQIVAEYRIKNSTFRKRKQRSLEKLKSTYLEILNAD